MYLRQSRLVVWQGGIFTNLSRDNCWGKRPAKRTENVAIISLENRVLNSITWKFSRQTIRQSKMSLQSLYSERKSRKYKPRDVTRGTRPKGKWREIMTLFSHQLPFPDCITQSIFGGCTLDCICWWFFLSMITFFQNIWKLIWPVYGCTAVIPWKKQNGDWFKRSTSSPGSSRFPIWRRQERRPWHTAN